MRFWRVVSSRQEPYWAEPYRRFLRARVRRRRRSRVKSLLLVLAIGAAAFGSPSCAKAPPGLTPQATRAFYGTQVIHDLDRLREVAVAAHATTPPILDAKETLAIVDWHTAAITAVHAAPAGWKASVNTGLDEALKKLSPAARRTIAPYVAIVRSILQEIP